MNMRIRKAAFLGDSITDGVGTDKIYHEYLSEWFGFEALNYGVNGAQTDTMYNQAQSLYAQHPDVDAVFVLGGTNDFNHGLPIGEFFTETYDAVNHDGALCIRKRRDFVMNTQCFCGRLNRLLTFLKRSFPDADVYLMTPVHRGYAAFGETNVQPDESWANGLGLYIDDYVRAVRRAGELYSVPVIDLFAQSGLMPVFGEYAGYFHDGKTDMLHPGARGHERIARTIAKVLSTEL